METNIESHLIEKRVFKPAKDFSKKARIKSLAQYRKMYRESMRRPDAFWVREAKELVWRGSKKHFAGSSEESSCSCFPRAPAHGTAKCRP